MNLIDFMIACGIVIVAMFTFLVAVSVMLILIILIASFVKQMKLFFKK